MSALTASHPLDRIQVSVHRRSKKKWIKPYLIKLAETGNYLLAATHVGKSKHTMEQYRSKSPVFRKASEQAMSAHNDLIAAEVERRAVYGDHENLTFRGQKTWEWQAPDDTGKLVPIPPNVDPGTIPNARMVQSTVIKRSDTLLLETARAKIPEFRKNTEQSSVTNIGTVNVLAGKDLPAFKALDTQDMLAILRGQSS